MSYDPEELSALLRTLSLDYPEFVIGVTQTYGGRRLIAYRPRCAHGLYAVITEHPADLRRELDAAATAPAAP